MGHHAAKRTRCVIPYELPVSFLSGQLRETTEPDPHRDIYTRQQLPRWENSHQKRSYFQSQNSILIPLRKNKYLYTRLAHSLRGQRTSPTSHAPCPCRSQRVARAINPRVRIHIDGPPLCTSTLFTKSGTGEYSVAYPYERKRKQEAQTTRNKWLKLRVNSSLCIWRVVVSPGPNQQNQHHQRQTSKTEKPAAAAGVLVVVLLYSMLSREKDCRLRC